jgi:IstB-like ATP binding protein
MIGKSHLIQAIGLEVLKAGFVVLYRSIFDLVRKLLTQETMAGEARLLNKYLKPDLLVIDDMGLKILPQRAAWGRPVSRLMAPSHPPSCAAHGPSSARVHSLYPDPVIRQNTQIGMHSEEFDRSHTRCELLIYIKSISPRTVINSGGEVERHLEAV